MHKKFGIIALALFFSSCHVSSKTAMRGEGGRTAYNETLQRTTNEQMLLNLVRLRYVDFPYFLDVASITTQFTYGTKFRPTFPWPGFNNENPGLFDGEFSWQNQPTITYTPLEGQSFASQLFHPIDLVLIQQLVYSGWDVARVFRLTVQGMEDVLNIPTASGPIPNYEPSFEKFLKVVDLLRNLQLRGELQIGVQTAKDCDNKNLACGTSLQLAFPKDTPEARPIQEILPGSSSRGRYIIYTLPLGFTKEVEMGVLPRSLMSCMYYLSLGVDIPKEDAKAKAVCLKKTESHTNIPKEIIQDMFHVYFSSTRPHNAFVKVKYRDFWFYINDNDIESKRTFVLLLQIYNLQSKTVKTQTPFLSIQLGG